MAAYAAHTTNENTHLPTAQKTEQHKRAYLYTLRKMEVSGKKKSGEWAKSRKGSDRNNDRTRQKNKRGDIEKWDQTGSPEIPDRGRCRMQKKTHLLRHMEQK